jgi:enoyl-CoA hydratase
MGQSGTCPHWRIVFLTCESIHKLPRSNGPLSVAASKALVVETGWLPEEEARKIEGTYASPGRVKCRRQGGLQAFDEKRPPNFTGR